MRNEIVHHHGIQSATLDANIVVNGNQADQTALHPRLFGNFFEHLGFSVQGGVLAQLLLNPTMAGTHNLTPSDRAALLYNGTIAQRLHQLSPDERQRYRNWRPHLRVTGFGLLVLDDESEQGIPLPWKAQPKGSCKGSQPGRIGHSVLMQPAGHAALFSQGIFVPHHRVRTYEGHIWAKAVDTGHLQIQFRRRSGEILASTSLTWPQERWSKQSFSLSLTPGSLQPLEPLDFCIVAQGNGRVWIDQATLLPTDHVDGFDPEIIQKLRWLAPPVLRGPGGNFVSGYHFWHGIGDLDRRQTFPNRAWGGIDDNFMGTDEFLRLCALIGAEPHLCVNMGDGSPEEAAAWVEYVNGSPSSPWGRQRAANGHPEPYGVRLWEIGNEIYGPWQIGHCGPEENARRYRLWADAMLSVDPNLELLATGNCFDFDEPHHHWHEILLEEGGEHLSNIALHALPNNNREFDLYVDEQSLWYSLMAHTVHWEKIHLPNLMALARKYRPDQPIDISITEWGILGRTDRPQVGNLGGAIYAGLFFNMVMRLHQWIRVANATALLHGGCIRKAGPFIYHDPQVEVIQRYTRLAGGHLLTVEYTGPGYDLADNVGGNEPLHDIPYLDAVAVKKGDDEIDVVIVNRHWTYPVSLTLQMEGLSTYRLTSIEVMTGHSRAVNTPLSPEEVSFRARAIPSHTSAGSTQLELEPRSITWLSWKAG